MPAVSRCSGNSAGLWYLRVTRGVLAACAFLSGLFVDLEFVCARWFVLFLMEIVLGGWLGYWQDYCIAT